MTVQSAASAPPGRGKGAPPREPESRGRKRFDPRAQPPPRWAPPRKPAKRPGDDDVAGAMAGGPLSHQRTGPAPGGGAGAPAVETTPAVSAVADRILAGINRAGEPTVRLELNAGDWRGVDVDLVAGAHGLQVNVFAATAAARRVIQAQLTDLANALARRGLTAKQISVSVKRDNRRGSRQDDAQ
jgi:hypothetical protein